ncbi:Serine/threonine-protein phosphatase 7 long form [Glycine soja]
MNNGAVLMASSSSCSSNISIISGLNGEQDIKLHIRRVVPTYQGQEEIPEEITHLLRQSGCNWIMKMEYLKINVALITVLMERWRSKTHNFHMRYRECTITLQDVPVLFGLCVDRSPLISPTNLSWADLCEELLGVRPEEGELQGSMIKLSWLTHHFLDLNNHGGNLEQVERFTHAWILRFIGSVLFVDKSSNKVSVRYLQFLRDFKECSTYSWGSVVLGYLYREMCSATDYKTKSIGGGCDGEINILFVWEPYSTTIMLALPPICLVGSVAWCAVVSLICFQVIDSPSQPFNIHDISLRGKHEENWGQLLGPMINQWNNQTDFRVDAYPRQEGLLSFNSDYMVWYRRKTKMFVDPKDANMATLERIIEPLSHGPTTEREFPVQQLNILQSSVETKGIARRRETVEAEPYLYPQMAERGHEMYYTPPAFSQYPTQTYQYPFDLHQSDTSVSEHSLGGVAETYANFPWPTMTPSQQHDVPIETPNAPLSTQCNVPGVLICVTNFLLRLSSQHEEGDHRGRRNPDKQAQRWDRPCGTSSRHHQHQDD